ncbi:FecR domain-containing protein [Desulfococcaceae bacterium HSG9]|nr:FecR domain-containing protein [Desulfococcaceae bacterium HSG9]
MKTKNQLIFQWGSVYLCLILAGLLISPISTFAKQPDVTITLEHKDSLRTLAKQHFGVPDDWKIILYYNGFQNHKDLPPKASLVIPVQLYKNTTESLRKARELSGRASMEGARILAKDAIEKAIQLQQDSLNLKNQGKLEEALKIALQAVRSAKSALSEAQKKKLRAVSAILESRTGKVQSRKPAHTVWNNTANKQELIEKERIRTLSDSRAQILFIDGSTLNLDANALAVIGKMRENRIKKSVKTDVTVLKGDVLLLMASLGVKNNFKVSTPDVETDIRSRKFRASRDKNNITRISNYDGEIDVKAKGRQVTVKKNEGVKIQMGKQPGKPRKLLPPPLITAPATNQVLLSTDVRFVWQAIEGARSYKLEIADKRNFAAIIKEKTSARTDYRWKAPQRGIYYFRISTIDKEGLVGPYSEPLPFSVNTDVAPPYLAVHTPVENAVILDDWVNIRGITEDSASLTINDHKVAIADDHTFNHRLKLAQGPHTIVIKATDPAGFETIIKRHIILHPEKQLLFLDVPPLLVVNKSSVALKGRIRPRTQVKINGQPVILTETFSHVVKLAEGEHTLTFKASAPPDQKSDTTNTQIETVKVKVDLTPPALILEKLPSYSNKTNVTLAGHVSEDSGVTVNAQPVSLTDRHFKTSIALEEGENLFEIIAQDTAGNQTIKRLTLLRDTLPPKMTRKALSKAVANGGDNVTLIVEAQDKGVGLSRTGYFALVVNKQSFKGVLTLNATGDQYDGSIFIPPGITGAVQVHHIRIRDRLRNEFKWESGN